MFHLHTLYTGDRRSYLSKGGTLFISIFHGSQIARTSGLTQGWRFWLGAFLRVDFSRVKRAHWGTSRSGLWFVQKQLFKERTLQSQSKQSAKLFLQSSELGLPQPLTRRRVCPTLPSPGFWGRASLAGERGVGRVPISTRGHTLWYSLYIVRTLCLLVHAGERWVSY